MPATATGRSEVHKVYSQGRDYAYFKNMTVDDVRVVLDFTAPILK